MKEQRKIEEICMVQQPLWLLDNTYIWYDGESPTNNYNEKNNPHYSIKKHKSTKQNYIDRSKTIGK